MGGGGEMSTESTNPNQGNAPLTHAQERYIQTIFDYFHGKAEWPKRRYLERVLIKEDLDAREIGRSLLGRIGYPYYAVSWDSDTVAVLTVPDMTLCRDSDEELDAFIKVLRFCVQTYIEAETDAAPQVTSLDLIAHRHMTHEMATKVLQMIQIEPIAHGGVGQNGMQWSMNLTHDMITYRAVRTLDDYLAARPKLAQTLSAFGQSIFNLDSVQEGTDLDNGATSSQDVFVVHGHDEAAKESVARFIEHLGLKPIILHEQPNAGQTIIEKFEKHADVAFAVVLLTPDDVGASMESPTVLTPRARQNVVLELGFFFGKLGRSRVCALLKGGVERPSDIDGLLYVPMDDAGAWRAILTREIRAAGLTIVSSPS
jgi:predicted nucleotide-binding protein